MLITHVVTEVRASERAEVLNDERAPVHDGAGADLHPSPGQKVQDGLRAEV